MEMSCLYSRVACPFNGSNGKSQPNTAKQKEKCQIRRFSMGTGRVSLGTGYTHSFIIYDCIPHETFIYIYSFPFIFEGSKYVVAENRIRCRGRGKEMYSPRGNNNENECESECVRERERFETQAYPTQLL